MMNKDMNLAGAVARRLFFTNKVAIGRDQMGNVLEAEGVFLNRLGRNLPFFVLAGWSALMLVFAFCRV